MKAWCIWQKHEYYGKDDWNGAADVWYVLVLNEGAYHIGTRVTLNVQCDIQFITWKMKKNVNVSSCNIPKFIEINTNDVSVPRML